MEVEVISYKHHFHHLLSSPGAADCSNFCDESWEICISFSPIKSVLFSLPFLILPSVQSFVLELILCTIVLAVGWR